jgi:hypothetical protein
MFATSAHPGTVYLPIFDQAKLIDGEIISTGTLVVAMLSPVFA